MAACFTANLSNTDGGYIGFAGGYAYIDDLTIKAWDDTAGAWKTSPEVVENFTLTSGVGRDTMVHDAAGNLTYGGLSKYYYDAWNRLAKVKRAYRDANGVQVGSQIAAMSYDALGRRVIKDITNSGDWDCKYMYYFDGTRKIEKRNANQCVLEQFVWGNQYVDELVQIGLNEDPLHALSGENQENSCEQFYWVMQDANYNVLGTVTNTGDLTERYEYTPYGQRRVYTSSNAPVLESTHGAFGSALAAAHIADSLCDFNHQGLEYDKEISGGMYENRARMYNPTLGRFMQRDPIGYVDGMSLYQYCKSGPIVWLDSFGLKVIEKGEIRKEGTGHILGNQRYSRMDKTDETKEITVIKYLPDEKVPMLDKDKPMPATPDCSNPVLRTYKVTPVVQYDVVMVRKYIYVQGIQKTGVPTIIAIETAGLGGPVMRGVKMLAAGAGLNVPGEISEMLISWYDGTDSWDDTPERLIKEGTPKVLVSEARTKQEIVCLCSDK